MCRFVAYLGHEVLLDDVLVKPENSIVMQSLHARESTIPTNGDGFGLGWYIPSISHTPGLFTSVSPAWNDRNLLNITAKIMSSCFFAHVRAASAGGVTNYNCHPFVHEQWMLMHNGEIDNFITVKRHLRHLLDDDIYHWIQGETDSEHLFALFLQFAKGKDLTQLDSVAEILKKTITVINEVVCKYNNNVNSSQFNICLTDGQRIIAARYSSDINDKPESLHYSIGNRFVVKDGRYHMLVAKNNHDCTLIASEKLTKFHVEWKDVPVNHFLLVNKGEPAILRAIN